MFGARKVDGSSGSLETDYDPSKAKYDPVKDACWKKGDKVPYLALAKTFEKIDSISARYSIIVCVMNLERDWSAIFPCTVCSGRTFTGCFFFTARIDHASPNSRSLPKCSATGPDQMEKFRS